MNLIEFNTLFPDEESCEMKLREYREKEGVVCPRCGGRHHYWKQDKKMFECKECHYRQSLKSNTVMHGSQLPLRYWFIAMHLLTSTKKSFSASELQRQLGHKNYNPIWAMLHKLRIAMGKRDERYDLRGMVELDEGFFVTEVPEDERRNPRKRGRGSQHRSKVLVMAETVNGTPRSPKDKPTAVRCIKMILIDDLKAATMDGHVRNNIDSDSTVITDNSTSYTHFKDIVATHIPKVIPKGEVGKALPWVHIAISNAKRLLLDIHHDICPKYVQNYLNEFSWKFNRRYCGDKMFDRLIVTSVNYKNEFRYNI